MSVVYYEPYIYGQQHPTVWFRDVGEVSVTQVGPFDARFHCPGVAFGKAPSRFFVIDCVNN